MRRSAPQPERDVLYIMDPPKPPTNGMGTTGFVLSIIGLFTFGLLSPIALLFSFLGMFRKPRGFATMGMLFSLMGVGFLGSMVAVPVMVEQQDRAMRVYHEQEIETRDQIEKAVEEIRDLMGQTSPQSIDGFDGNAVTVLHRDAWENELRFDERKDGFAVRSAGKDAEFDTADDIVQAFVDTDVNTRRRHEVSL